MTDKMEACLISCLGLQDQRPVSSRMVFVELQMGELTHAPTSE